MKKILDYFKNKKTEINKIEREIDPLIRDTTNFKGSDQEWEEQFSYDFKSVHDFPKNNNFIDKEDSIVLDGKNTDGNKLSKIAMDSACNPMVNGGSDFNESLPPYLFRWYSSKTFIGYQACAIIAQHWLVNKACSMVGKDAVRKGWEVKSSSEKELSVEESELLQLQDKIMNISDQLIQAERFKNIFGVRVMIFLVESKDENYYSNPFNIDAVVKGSYKGISQVDPYWMTPLMSTESTSDPSSQHFYEPEYWVINGTKYHRTHLIILRNDEPADILKPLYLFGGVPLTQQIYDRVYASERTANEAPLLSLSKRTTTLKTDLEQALANEKKFKARIMEWVKYRDNYGVKVIGTKELVEQHDVNLSDFDSLIMNQYQLVAAIAKVPSTKLLGTSPKGFNATGEFEMVSYHEELETIQKHNLTPILDKHYELLLRSTGIDTKVKIVWLPVGSLSAKQQADINFVKSQTALNIINNGSISPDEDRQRIKDDKHSGYNRLDIGDASNIAGSSPENIALLQKSKGEQLRGVSFIEKSKGEILNQAAEYFDKTGILPEGSASGSLTLNPPVNVNDESTGTNEEDLYGDLEFNPYSMRTVNPAVKPTVQPTVVNFHSVIDKMDKSALPKIKVNGINCLIENPRNSIRKGNSIDGAWSIKMPNHYGFIEGTTGADGDELDCFIGKDFKSDKVFVVNQNDVNSNQFDEHKCMIGFSSKEEAKDEYLKAYSFDWQGLESIVEMNMDEFKEWIKGDTSNPLKNIESKE